jgi:phage baseplate assembly protein W
MPTRGIRYPFNLFGGAPTEATDDTLVASALTQLFSQEKRERVYADLNGVNLVSYVFDNLNDVLRANLRREITLAVSRFEGRVKIEKVVVRFVQVGGKPVVDLVLLWRYQGRVYSAARALPLDELTGTG